MHRDDIAPSTLSVALGVPAEASAMTDPVPWREAVSAVKAYP